VTRRVLLAGLLVFLWTESSSAQGPEFVIIVNKANPVRTLPIAEVRRIFMKQSRMWPHAEPMVPVDWDSTSAIRQVFSRRILNRSVREMAEYWVQQSMTRGLTRNLIRLAG
jgi:hypothetical protein